MRRENPELFGNSEISIGLWVGGSAAPNTLQKAYEELDKFIHGEMFRNPIQVEKCPWCGTAIFPREKSSDEREPGVHYGPEHFSLFCPEETCPFHERLPVEVVDENLYENPPTLLLATVDKFARLPWVKETGKFFGNGHVRPPELIIQDLLDIKKQCALSWVFEPMGTTKGVFLGYTGKREWLTGKAAC